MDHEFLCYQLASATVDTPCVVATQNQIHVRMNLNLQISLFRWREIARTPKLMVTFLDHLVLSVRDVE